MNDFNFSKSKYCGFWQCPKIAWLSKYKPEERNIDEQMLHNMEVGDRVGDLAMELFEGFVDVTAYSDDNRLDLIKMVKRTQQEMEHGADVICEASFLHDGLYCAVDILVREGDGWAIYEVKSSTHDDKAVYMADVAYQYALLKKSGLKITGTYLICLNSEYEFDGELDLDQLFSITDVSEHIAIEVLSVKTNLELAKTLLGSSVEPEIRLSLSCNDPYRCQFWEYCTKDLPDPSVFDLYRMRFSKKLEYYQEGATSFEQLQFDPRVKNEKQLRQIDHALHDLPDHIDRYAIRGFLEQMTYPLYFLDFETVQTAVPEYVGTKPYAQIPFQYSLHYFESENDPLRHKEFLADPFEDPRRPLAERLCEDIPVNVCVVAYNKAFECSRLKELAGLFPDLADHLLAIERNIIDLLVPFQSGWYYNRAMGGSFSIKSVLPALFPGDPTLDYKNLEGIHHGGEAMNAWPAMRRMSLEEQKMTRRNLLKYCELDTFAMVKIYQKLIEVVV